MSSNRSGRYNLSDGGVVSWTGKVMVGAIIVLFVAVVAVVFLHLYAKWFWRRNGDPNSQSRRRRRFVFNQDQAAAAARRGLEPSILRSLPVITFQSVDFKEGLECAVCLCDLSDGEKARMLPKCNHGFHLECIDMWFQSHSTCPLCRDMVAPKSSPISGPEELPEVQAHEANGATDGQAAESVNFPTNVLFWGSEDQVNTGRARAEEGPSSSSTSSSSSSTNGDVDRSGKIVIDIPRVVIEGLPATVSPNSGRSAEEDLKSPATRLRSLRRLLSREPRLAIPSSPRGGDIEQGLVRGNARTPKTPTGGS